jgi:hypothetical protein
MTELNSLAVSSLAVGWLMMDCYFAFGFYLKLNLVSSFLLLQNDKILEITRFGAAATHAIKVLAS